MTFFFYNLEAVCLFVRSHFQPLYGRGRGRGGGRRGGGEKERDQGVTYNQLFGGE